MKMSDIKSKKIEYTEEMLELFFIDSIQPLLVVSAQTQKFILANEALFELLDTTDDLLLGKKWYDLDSEDNKEKYHEYIKQINSNENIIFPIQIPNQKPEKILSCEYHLGFLDGEMVYVGLLKAQQATDFSNNLIEYIDEINHLPINIQGIETYFIHLKKKFDLDFLVYFENDNESVNETVIVANAEVKNAITDSGLNAFVTISKSKKNAEINRITDFHGQHFKLLNLLKTETLLVYPIHHKQKVMGSFVMGYNTRQNNQAIKIILLALVSRCQLCLYEKDIISQRNKEGQFA